MKREPQEEQHQGFFEKAVLGILLCFRRRRTPERSSRVSPSGSEQHLTRRTTKEEPFLLAPRMVLLVPTEANSHCFRNTVCFRTALFFEKEDIIVSRRARTVYSRNGACLLVSRIQGKEDHGAVSETAERFLGFFEKRKRERQRTPERQASRRRTPRTAQ